MSGAFVLLKIIGFVTLLLYGTHMVTNGMLKGFGGDLRQKIGQSLSNRFKAFFAGIGVTLALQSSTATGLMASSFAAHGILSPVPGFVLMLGANVGTALVTQILSFPAELLAGPLFLMGFLLFKSSKTTKWENLGKALIGIGVMFLSLHELVNTFKPLGQLEVMQAIFKSLEDQVFLSMLVGAVAAWLCHSSVAVVLLVLSVMSGGGLPLEAALAMVLGANLGGAVPPFMEVSGSVARRLPLGNLLVRSVGVLCGLAALPQVHQLLININHLEPRVLVDVHVAFNIVLALLAFPFAKPVSVLLVKLLPDPPVENLPGQPRYLDSSVSSQSHLAMANAEREVLHLSDTVSEQLLFAQRAIKDNSADAVIRCGMLGDAVTGLGRSIRSYLGQIPVDAMSDNDKKRSLELMDFVINIEHAADLMAHQLVEPLVSKQQEGNLMSKDQVKTINELMNTLSEGLSLSIVALIRRDEKAARQLIAQKIVLRNKEIELDRMSSGNSLYPNTHGGIELDVASRAWRECRSIYGHFAAIGYHILDQAGQLRSRVVDGGGS